MNNGDPRCPPLPRWSYESQYAWCWYGTEWEGHCPEDWHSTCDGCDIGCQFTDEDCSNDPHAPIAKYYVANGTACGDQSGCASCENGECLDVLASGTSSEGAACPAWGGYNSDCSGYFCQGGECTWEEKPDHTQCGEPGNVCQSSECQQGSCDPVLADAGTPCGDGGTCSQPLCEVTDSGSMQCVSEPIHSAQCDGSSVFECNSFNCTPSGSTSKYDAFGIGCPDGTRFECGLAITGPEGNCDQPDSLPSAAAVCSCINPETQTNPTTLRLPISPSPDFGCQKVMACQVTLVQAGAADDAAPNYDNLRPVGECQDPAQAKPCFISYAVPTQESGLDRCADADDGTGKVDCGPRLGNHSNVFATPARYVDDLENAGYLTDLQKLNELLLPKAGPQAIRSRGGCTNIRTEMGPDGCANPEVPTVSIGMPAPDPGGGGASAQSLAAAADSPELEQPSTALAEMLTERLALLEEAEQAGLIESGDGISAAAQVQGQKQPKAQPVAGNECPNGVPDVDLLTLLEPSDAAEIDNYQCQGLTTLNTYSCGTNNYDPVLKWHFHFDGRYDDHRSKDCPVFREKITGLQDPYVYFSGVQADQPLDAVKGNGSPFPHTVLTFVQKQCANTIMWQFSGAPEVFTNQASAYVYERESDQQPQYPERILVFKGNQMRVTRDFYPADDPNRMPNDWGQPVLFNVNLDQLFNDSGGVFTATFNFAAPRTLGLGTRPITLRTAENGAVMPFPGVPNGFVVPPKEFNDRDSHGVLFRNIAWSKPADEVDMWRTVKHRRETWWEGASPLQFSTDVWKYAPPPLVGPPQLLPYYVNGRFINGDIEQTAVLAELGDPVAVADADFRFGRISNNWPAFARTKLNFIFPNSHCRFMTQTMLDPQFKQFVRRAFVDTFKALKCGAPAVGHSGGGALLQFLMRLASIAPVDNQGKPLMPAIVKKFAPWGLPDGKLVLVGLEPVFTLKAIENIQRLPMYQDSTGKTRVVVVVYNTLSTPEQNPTYTLIARTIPALGGTLVPVTGVVDTYHWPIRFNFKNVNGNRQLDPLGLALCNTEVLQNGTPHIAIGFGFLAWGELPGVVLPTPKG